MVDPDLYLAEAGLPVDGVTATFRYGGQTFNARTWGGKSAAALLDIHQSPVIDTAAWRGRVKRC